MKYKIRFINHSSFSIESDNSLMLLDPWYSGRVFNNSWSLISDTDINNIAGISKLDKIILSHEHPDHLHWGTLQNIRSLVPNNTITVYMPVRHNHNVKDKIEEMGFSFEYLNHWEASHLDSDLTVCPFPAGHDSALVFDVDGKILLNQNDAYLHRTECERLMKMYPKIDAWWMQFSLAGYYANKTDKEALWNNGHMYHLNMFKAYQEFFKPSTSIPYASFCYFCKYYNSYINDVAVTPQNVVDCTDLPVQVLHYNQEMSWNPDPERSLKALEEWKNSYDNDRVIDDLPRSVSREEIISNGDALMPSVREVLAPSAYFLLYDYPEEAVHLSFRLKKVEFVPKNSVDSESVAGITSSEEFNSYLKFPWGADTLNITGAFEKKNQKLWDQMIGYRDNLYVR